MYDVIIIGGGTAGLTAGLYAGRFRMQTLIIEKIVPGGQILWSEKIENFPAFPGGISTHELIARMIKQVEDQQVKIESDTVVAITPDRKKSGPNFAVEGKDTTRQARSVIIACGARPKSLGVTGEDQFIGKGVSYCGTCDAPLFRNKKIMVIGGGNTALEEAIYLAGYAAEVTVIHRREGLRASKVLEEKARSNAKISFILDSVIEAIKGQGSVEAASVRNLKTGAVSDRACQGVFIFVGIQPNTDFVKNLLRRDGAGFIMTDHALQTSEPGIFACGDCVKKNLYQVITACAEGALSADSAHKYIINL